MLHVVNPLYSNTNQQLFENNLCNRNSHYENYGWFCVINGSLSCACHKIDTFCGEQRWMGHKEGHW